MADITLPAIPAAGATTEEKTVKKARAPRKAKSLRAELTGNTPKADAKGKHALPPLGDRASNVQSIYLKAIALFNSANGNTVANVAAALKVKERQVRAVIDKARGAHGYKTFERVSPGRFRYAGVPKMPKGK